MNRSDRCAISGHNLTLTLAAVLWTALLPASPAHAASPPDRYEEILRLIKAEHWRAASDKALRYLATIERTGTEDAKSVVRYIIIYTSAGAVSIGKMHPAELGKRIRPLLGQRLALPGRPVFAACPGSPMNRICADTGASRELMIAAANQRETTIHAFEHIKLKTPMPLRPHAGEIAFVRGKLKAFVPRESRIAILDLYLEDATVTFESEQKAQ